MNREQFEKLWDGISKDEDNANYITLDAGLRLAWRGDIKEYEYWLEEYDKVRKIWWRVEEKEVEDLVSKLMSHIIFTELTKRDLRSKIDLDSEVYE